MTTARDARARPVSSLHRIAAGALAASLPIQPPNLFLLLEKRRLPGRRQVMFWVNKLRSKARRMVCWLLLCSGLSHELPNNQNPAHSAHPPHRTPSRRGSHRAPPDRGIPFCPNLRRARWARLPGLRGARWRCLQRGQSAKDSAVELPLPEAARLSPGRNGVPAKRRSPWLTAVCGTARGAASLVAARPS